jgi:hypothetical protein
MVILQVGDLVRLSHEYVDLHKGVNVWRYGGKSDDADYMHNVIAGRLQRDDVALVVKIDDESYRNVMVALSNGTVGWTRMQYVEIVSRLSDAMLREDVILSIEERS